jgi:hypothetical protein
MPAVLNQKQGIKQLQSTIQLCRGQARLEDSRGARCASTTNEINDKSLQMGKAKHGSTIGASL